MKQFYIHITKYCFTLSILFSSFFGVINVAAQTSSNPNGFEDGTIVDWAGGSGTETAALNVAVAYCRTGTKSLSLGTTSTSTNRNWYSHYPYGASAVGTYVHFIYWAKASAASTSVNASLRYTGFAPPTGAGSLVTGTVVALATASWTRVAFRAGGVAGRWYFPSPRKTTSNATTFYIDDLIIYTSTSGTDDITGPSQATGATGNNVTGLSWTNGNDTGTGATGVQATLIFKRTAGAVGSGGLTLNDQGIYSLTATEGPSVVGNWTLLDASLASGATTYSTGTFTVGEEYAVVHRDLAYNYSTPTYVVITASTLANVTTEPATGITTTSAVGNGTITYVGSGITVSGLCWNTTGTPTTSDSKTTDGSLALGSYVGTLTPLAANTLYYVRAYATTGGGTSYGNQVSFPTLSNPPIIGAATNITSISFKANWNTPVAQGSAPFTYHVQVTQTSGDYSVLDAEASGIPSTNLTQLISGLNPTTTYYYRVRAVNASGESNWSAESAAVSTLTQTSLTVNILPAGAGTVTADTTIAMPSGVPYNFTTNEVVTLTAIPAAGYGFLRWVIGLVRTGDNPYDITMSENKTVTALFGLVNCLIYNFEDVSAGQLSTASYVTVPFTSGSKTWNAIDGRLNQAAGYSHGGTQSIRLKYATGSIVTPTAIRPTRISFWARVYTPSYATTAKVYYSLDGGVTYAPKEILTAVIPTDGLWYNFARDTVFAATNVRFKIRDISGADLNYNIVIDDVEICEGPDAIPPALTFTPVNGATGVDLLLNQLITSDEGLYRYVPTTGANLKLTVGDLAFSNPDTVATFLTLIRVSDGIDVPFSVNIDATGKILTIDPTDDLDFFTTYKLTISNISDSLGNVLSSPQYSQFTTEIPPSPVISIKEVLSDETYNSGSIFNFGTLFSAGTITKTFRLSNIGTDPLTITSCTLSTGIKFIKTLDPDANIAAGGSTDIIIEFTPGAVNGVFNDTLVIASNDIEHPNYVIYFVGTKADFVLTYTYQSGCTEPVMLPNEMTHDYTSLLDIPVNITKKDGVPLAAINFFPSYTVFQGEGNCMPSGSSVLKVGQDAHGLEIKLPNCGQVTLKWCSNGYRKVKISDKDGNLYEQSPSYLPSNMCYTTSTVVNTPDSIYLRIEFIGNDPAVLTTLYYMQITPYNPSLLSSGRNIVEFETGIAGERVRIYDDVILVSVPTGNDLTNLAPTIINTSPFSSVSPLSGVAQDFSTGAVTYTVTAQDGQTKDYSVRIEYGVTYGASYYDDTIAITVDMDRGDKTLELVEVTNSTCEVPVFGNGSNYTIYFLDPTDMPVGGYTIEGPSRICIGTIAEYTINNAVETNNPSYNWSIQGTARDLFTIIGDTISDVLRLQAPNEMVEGTIDFSVIVEFDPSQCIFLRGEDQVSVGVTDHSPEPITGITALCAYNGLLTVTADGSTDATSYNWDFTPFTPVVSQDNNSIVLNIGTSSEDISAQVNTQNGCGITEDENDYDIPYAKEWTKWDGSFDTDWSRHANWSDRVPKACTDVVIPDVGSGVAYPIIGTGGGECHYITFEPGGAVLNLQRLEYVRAYVQLTTQREKWYTLTAPLKNMYSADYAYQGTPVTKMRLFDQINPDSISTGGALNVGTWTRSFSDGEVSLTPGMGFAFWLDPKTFNYPNPITWVYTDITHYFPRETSTDNLMTLQYYYSTYSGILLTDYPINLPRDPLFAYRFAMEDATGDLQDLNIHIKPGLNLLGNPLMTHMDFTAFRASNAAKISNKVKFWNGTTFTTYMVGSEISSDLDLTSTSIPPMQSFFVEGLLDGDVTIDLETHFFVDLTTKLRNAGTTPNTMHIKTNNGIKQSSTAIAMRPDGSNFYGYDDAFKLFSQYNDVPEVYTLADDIALDINQFDSLPYRVPLGLKTTKIGNVTYTFTGAESFADVEVTLLNTRTGEQQNLKANPAYVVNYEGTNPDGYLFLEFRNANSGTGVSENETCSKCIQVYQKDERTIGVVSPVTDKINNITVWEQSGKMLYNKFGINNYTHDIVVSPHQACVVRVTTESSTYVVKLLMK